MNTSGKFNFYVGQIFVLNFPSNIICNITFLFGRRDGYNCYLQYINEGTWENKMLSHSVPLKTITILTLSQILEVLRVGWRKSTPRFAFLPELGNLNIKYFIHPRGNRTHNCRVYGDSCAHGPPPGLPLYYVLSHFNTHKIKYPIISTINILKDFAQRIDI